MSVVVVVVDPLSLFVQLIHMTAAQAAAVATIAVAAAAAASCAPKGTRPRLSRLRCPSNCASRRGGTLSRHTCTDHNIAHVPVRLQKLEYRDKSSVYFRKWTMNIF